MKIDKYDLEVGTDYLFFDFVSEGPKGRIPKLIIFQPTDSPQVFNLAFGDKDIPTGNLNDMAVSNNGDTDKVLATVSESLYIFFDHFPDVFVYAAGSTPARTRLYRMGITRFYHEIQKDFYLLGQTGSNFAEFEIGKYYDGFLITRKFN